MNGEQEARAELVAFGAALYDRGLTPGRTGNLSVRIGDHVLITPTNTCLGRLDPARIALVDAVGEHVDGDPPSKELPLHRALYEQHLDGAAVAHLHSTYAVAVSCLEGLNDSDALPPITPYYLMRVGTLPRVGYHMPGSSALEEAVRLATTRSPSLLLANHGSLAVAATLSAALDAVEEIEETARLFLLMDGLRSRYLSPADADALLSRPAKPRSVA